MELASEEARILLALRAINRSKPLSLRRAAKLYDVPFTTLRDRKAGRPARHDIQPNCRKLTSYEEQVIVRYILELDSRGFPPRLCRVEDMANLLLAERNAGRVGTRWAQRFVKRQPELDLRFNRRYDYQRAQCEDLVLIQGWFELLRNTIAKYGITDADIYNFDETGFMMGVISTAMVVTSSEKVGRAKAKQPGNREWVTVIQAINAIGWSLPPFVVVKAKNILLSWYDEFKLPKGWRLGVSDNGWTTNDLGLQWIQHFEKHTHYQKVGAYRLLILDGHDSHHSVEFELFCQEHDIITLCMPAHSSHILQPLDVGCFSPLKKAYGKQIEELMRDGQTHIAKEDFFPAFQVAFQESFTLQNIQGAFRGAGISPFDPQRVLDTLPPRPITPSVQGSRPSTAQTWDPTTPKNATDASRQASYIKNQISQHQGSSPTRILSAVDQFTKGSVAIMHEVALLRSRITGLEATNERLSKRRRTKNTRLQKGGSLSVEEAEELMAHRSSGSQQGSGAGGSSGSGQAAQLRIRRCGNCGETGHNARTCQAVVETSSEDELYNSN
jgi:DDE superfamily endonuclease/helix-turn-helix, Psq domain